MVYMDLNPVRAGMVADPATTLVEPPALHRPRRTTSSSRRIRLYWSLGNTPFAREQAYADLVAAGVRPRLQTRSPTRHLRGWASGRDRTFVADLQAHASAGGQAQAGPPEKAEPVPD
jgi:putative transposase